MMLQTELSTEFTALMRVAIAVPTLVAALAWYYAYRCWDFCRDTEDLIKNLLTADPPGVKKLTDIECELTEHADSLSALHGSLKKLRARVGMRENRGVKRSSGDDIPDSATDPTGYKDAMRLRLRAENKI